ncbi:MAG: TrmH family RNA methyltransferase [Thermomicrobiales bacterium]|jgi:TrmH family RNA methyltransferase|nr:RNA methyltransferase [Thermomicrobiales bacterium]
MVTTVTSLDNPTVKQVRALSRRRERYKERAFVVEGARLLGEALAAGAVPRAVLLARDLLGEGPAQDRLLITLSELREGAGRNMRVLEVTPDVLRSVSETESPQGIVATFAFPEQREPSPGPPLIVVADGVRDPGNLGTLLRAALGAGATLFCTTSATVDLYNPKVVRAAMGAHFRLALRSHLGWDRLPQLLADCEAVWGADADGETVYSDADWRAPSAVIVGNEDRGLTPEGRRHCTGSVAIPLQGGLESLNVAVAAAVLLFEAARQRR